jgi:hypothetical protein|tara:strand:+ start:437 stop:697 length:261 start_codon:yes stop_codon:yes gene_type:complete
MECPSCSLTNPPDAIRCDCGFDFRTASTYSAANEVIVKGIKMPFLSMVVFMLKLAIAAIPAVIIIRIILLICSFIGSVGSYNVDDY